MTSRERVLAAINRTQPDKVPFSLGATIVDGFTSYGKDEFEDYKGWPRTEMPITNFMMRTVVTPPQIEEYAQTDFVTVGLKSAFSDKVELEADGTYLDDFGCRIAPAQLYYDTVASPLAGEDITLKDVANCPWMDPYAPGRAEGLREEALRLRESTDKALVANILCLGPFEGGCHVRGFEDFLMDFYLNPAIAEAIMDRITEMAIGLYDVLLSEVGDLIDIVCQGDDVGMQDRAFVSAEIYEKYILKYHKRMYSYVHSRTEAKIFHHSCGSVRTLIPGLIEAGVDILEPIQTSAAGMDPAEIKREFGKDLCFWGGLDTQKMLQNGTPEEIDAEVKRLVEILGAGGGYVFSPGHNIQHGVPPQNVDAMIKAIQKYR